MKTEAKRAFDCGFALAEGELRRLHDLLVQQIKRTPAADGFQTFYEVKYRNGSVGYPTGLDEVLSEENFGSAAILRLKVEIGDKAEKPSSQISVEFINADEEEGSSTDSIKYRVSGDDRDWVFVTSSQLDERIGKIRLFAPNQLLSRKRRFWVTMVPLVALLIFFGFSSITPTARRHEEAQSQLDALERAWRAGTLKDPPEVTVEAARILLGSQDIPGKEVIWLPIGMASILLGLPLLGYCYVYFRPLYNFLWGDYVAKYERRRSVGRFVFVGVLVALVVSVMADLISRRIVF
jgi:hypothetical protein